MNCIRTVRTVMCGGSDVRGIVLHSHVWCTWELLRKIQV